MKHGGKAVLRERVKRPLKQPARTARLRLVFPSGKACATSARQYRSAKSGCPHNPGLGARPRVACDHAEVPGALEGNGEAARSSGRPASNVTCPASACFAQWPAEEKRIKTIGLLFAVLLCSAASFAQLARPTVYIEPQSGFETYLAAAISKKS